MRPDGSGWVLRTRDAGSHWTSISNHFVQNMHFIDVSVGVGGEFDGRKDRFVKTSDGGRTWIASSVPGMKFINKVFFITADIGWVAGTNDLSNDLSGRAAVVLRTTDGGRDWKSFQLPSEIGVAEIRDLYFRNQSDGWMVIWHYNRDGTHLYRTMDGGMTWTLHPDESIQGAGKWLAVVRFLNPKVGFAFSRDDDLESGQLLYSEDGGEHWRSNSLDAWVYDCQLVGSDLGCSASTEKPSFLMLWIKPKAETN